MFVAWICVSLAHASWTLMSVTQAKNIQEEFEKLDKIPVQRFFEEYLSKGQVQDMKLRFVGDENKEIVVTLVNGRQFIVHTNWRKFHKKLAEFEEEHNIHPSERKAGKDMEVLSKDSDYFGMYRPITDYGDFKTNCDSKIMGLYITLLINASFIFAYGGPKKNDQQL